MCQSRIIVLALFFKNWSMVDGKSKPDSFRYLSLAVNSLQADLIEEVGPLHINFETAFGVCRNVKSALIGDD